MSENTRKIQELLKSAIELSRKKELADNKDRLLQAIKEHPNYALFVENINKKFDGKDTPILWTVRNGANPSLFDALEIISKEISQKEATEQWKLTAWVTSRYDLYQDISLMDGANIFLIAVQTGNLALVRHLVEKGENIYSPSTTGLKALHLASESGNVQMVQYLIETCNFNPYEVDAENRNLFYIAEVRGHRELNEYLRAYESDHKVVQEFLHHAVSIQNDPAKLNALFQEKKAKFIIDNINQKYNGLNTVQLALRLGANQTLMSKLIELSRNQAIKTKGWGAAYDVVNDVDTQDGYALLHIAAKLGRNDLIELLLKNKADINQPGKYTGRTPLLCAIKAKHINSVEALISARAEVNIVDKRKKSALIWAIQKKLNSLIPLLLRISKNQATFSAYNPLKLGQSEFDISTAVDEQGRTPLHYAVKYIRTIDLKTGADLLSQHLDLLSEQGKKDVVNKQDNLGLTPLHHAILAGNLAAVKLLVQKGKAKIDIAAAGDQNLTPLLLAARGGQIEIVKFLISEKADVSHRAINQQNILHQAVRSGNVELIQFLLEHPSTKNLINERDRLQRLPLHIAARLGFDSVVKLLIAKEPSHLFALDKHHETPIRSAFKIARTHFHDTRGDSLSTIEVLRTAMNKSIHHRTDQETKGRDESDVGRDQRKLDISSKQFLAVDHQQKVAMRPDLITDLLEPVMNLDGSITAHQVKILHEGKGFHCLVFIPTHVEGAGQQKIDLKVVFCTPSQSKDILQSVKEINKLDSLRKNLSLVTQKMGEIVQEVQQSHPHAAIGISVSGKGLGGDDAQYCAYALMRAIEQDKQFEPVKDFRLMTINAPKVNRKMARDAFHLAKKLKSNRRLSTLESSHLVVEGSLLPLIGDHYLLGDEQGSSAHPEQDASKDTSAGNIQYLRDKKRATEMLRLIENIKPALVDLDKKRKELAEHQKKISMMEQELSVMIFEAESNLMREKKENIERAVIIDTLKKSSRHFTDLFQKLDQFKKIDKKLEGELHNMERKIFSAVEKLKELENEALNLNLDYGKEQERIPSLQFSLTDLSPVTLYNPGGLLSLGLSTGLDHSQATSLDQLLHGPRASLEPLVFSVSSNKSVSQLALLGGDQKRDSERKRVSEQNVGNEVDAVPALVIPAVIAGPAASAPAVQQEKGYREEVYKSLLEHAEKYKRGKSAFEQLYASGEYLYHHLAYQNLEEGDIVPVLSDQGTLVNYKVQPIVNLRGIVTIALTPLHGVGEVKILFRGTHNIDSAARDLSSKSAGHNSFKQKEKVFLGQINKILAQERRRLKAENLPEKIQLSIGGHSLGAADAQYCFVLFQQAIARNKFERMKVSALPHSGSEDKERREAREVGESEVSPISPTSPEEFNIEDPNLLQALGERIPPEYRDQLEGITDLRLQAYNAPGVTDETAWQSGRLARFLCSPEEGHTSVKQRAYYQRVNADIVHRAGQAHILTNCPRRFAEVDVLKFIDYRSISTLQAHTDKQFTREISDRTAEHLNPKCFEHLKNNQQGNIINKSGTFEFEDKLEPNLALYQMLKNTLEYLVKTQLQEPERGTGQRI